VRLVRSGAAVWLSVVVKARCSGAAVAAAVAGGRAVRRRSFGCRGY